jgi:hypothetical protein
MREVEPWDGVCHDLPDDPQECADFLIRVGKLLVKGPNPCDDENQRDRASYCEYSKWYLKNHHPRIWKKLNQQYDLDTYVHRVTAKKVPAVLPAEKMAKSTRTRSSPEQKELERMRLLKFSVDELVNQIGEAPDRLMDFCRAVDNYGVLTLRLLVEICPDTTAAVVLSQILFWHCRGRHGRPRVGKQNWLRKTHADLANETGLTKDQVRGALQRLQKEGLCERQRGTRTSLLNPCLEVIAKRVWAAFHRREREG